MTGSPDHTRYDFDRPLDRRASDSIKWRAYGEEVLPLWVADMDFVSPEPVIRALHERAAHGVFGYPAGIDGSPHELAGFRQVLVERLAERYGWEVPPEALLFIPGVVTGFNLACHALAEPGGRVLVQTPIYPPMLSAARHAGMARVDNQLRLGSDGRYEIDWEGFEAALAEGVRMFLLCSPHNPVGRVFQRDELERMAELCLRYGTIICSDEIHCDLIFRGHLHQPMGGLGAEVAARTLTLIAPSKTYNIAGLECSVAIIPDAELRRRYMQATKGLMGWVNLMGLAAGEAAYRHGQAWLDQVLAYLEANRDFLHDYVCRELPGVKMCVPEGTYLAWLDCREAGIAGPPGEFFLKKARVALNEGTTFGPGGTGFVRLNFGCPRATLAEALDRMKGALGNHS